MSQAAKGSRNLAWAAAAALVSLGLMALPFGGLPKALVLMPLVLFLPGYALTAAFFPGRSLSGGERLVYSVTLSVGAASLGGLAWQLAFGLTRYAWAGLLTAIVLLACAAARHRRAAAAAATEPQRPAGEGLRLDLPTAIMGAAGVALTVVAVALAIGGVREQRARSHFSALWAVSNPENERKVEIGVANHQGAAHEYRIAVRSDGALIWSWEGRLGARKGFEAVLGRSRIPSGARLVVSLFKDGLVYRRTELQTGLGT